jgi:hypothetical protein
MLWRYVDQAERRQGVESCCHGEGAGAPAGREIVDARRGEHDDERIGPGARCAAYEAGTHCEVGGCAGTKRALDRRQSVVAVMHTLFVGWRWREGSCESIAASELCGFVLRTCMDCHSHGALRYGQRDPGSDTPVGGAGNALLQRARGGGAGLRLEVLLLLGDKRLERSQWRGPGVPACLGTHRLTPEHGADALLRAHRSHLRIEAVQVKRPLSQQCCPVGIRDSGNGMEPVLSAVCAWLALEQAPGADAGELLNATSCLALLKLRRTGGRRLGLAGTHCDGDGRAVRGAESADAKRLRACLASAVIAQRGQCVVCAFPGAARASIHKQVAGRGLCSLVIESVLDRGLGSGHPSAMRRARLLSKRAYSQPRRRAPSPDARLRDASLERSHGPSPAPGPVSLRGACPGPLRSPSVARRGTRSTRHQKTALAAT